MPKTDDSFNYVITKYDLSVYTRGTQVFTFVS